MSYTPASELLAQAVQLTLASAAPPIYLDDPRHVGVDTSTAFSSFQDLLALNLNVGGSTPIRVRVHGLVSANCSQSTTILVARIALNGAPLTPPMPIADTAGQSNSKAHVHVLAPAVQLAPGAHVFTLQWARLGIGTLSVRPVSSPSNECGTLYAERIS